MNHDLTEKLALPFQLLFNFRKLIKWWQKQAESDNPIEAEKAAAVLKHIENMPQLSEPIADIDELQKYQPEIEMLLA
ncbi:MAG TPA: hypothetical protein VK616_05775, partial [Flavitalea sp.]|nr:hypothetical protein [Flavitalea sp.]